MKKILWIVGTIVAGMLWSVVIGFIGFGITIATTIITHSGEVVVHENLWGAIILIGWVVLAILSVWMWKRFKLKCQACKRWGALELIKTEFARQEKISVLVEVERRDLQRNVIGTQDQYIPGKRKIFTDTYKCKFCGHLETRTHTRESADI